LEVYNDLDFRGILMKKLSLSLVAVLGLLVAGACGKKPAEQAQTAATNNPAPANGATPGTPSSNGEIAPAAAAPNDLPAVVTLTDGSKYTGTLVSKQGTQLTFRGENGADRTFDNRDIKGIRFGNPDTAASNPAPSAPAATPRQRPARTRESAPARANDEGSASAPAAPQIAEIVIPSGTQISVRTNDAIDSKTASAGQTFSAEIARSVADDSGNVAIPQGSPATLVVREAGAGKVHANDLTLDMSAVNIGGRSYDVETASLVEKGKQGIGTNKRTAKFGGGGAALGAIIGAIAGGGKGAAIGAATGGAAGVGTQVFTRGSVKVPAETILTFQLTSPLSLQSR
jgi:hypothetical protein